MNTIFIIRHHNGDYLSLLSTRQDLVSGKRSYKVSWTRDFSRATRFDARIQGCIIHEFPYTYPYFLSGIKG
jgi:hypothetical protein